MNSPLRASRLRLALGILGATSGLGVAFFLLPDASQQLAQQLRAKREAELTRNQQVQRLQELQQLADRIRRGRDTLSDLETRLPRGSAGELQWSLSKTLHELATKNGLRLQTVKYSLPSREGARGTDLEAVEVEFVALGVYANHKAFMRDLEGSGLPFAVRDGRLEESPEGARLNIVLRAFRKASSPEREEGEA
jgi:Tfp pilus assembly protein PilN